MEIARAVFQKAWGREVGTKWGGAFTQLATGESVAEPLRGEEKQQKAFTEHQDPFETHVGNLRGWCADSNRAVKADMREASPCAFLSFLVEYGEMFLVEYAFSSLKKMIHSRNYF